MHAEQAVGVGPGVAGLEAGGGGEGLEAVEGVFPGVLDVDGLAGGDRDDAVGQADALILQGAQLDADAALVGQVMGLVPEGGEVEAGAELTVGALEQVQAEGGGDALAVVIGGLEDVAGLAQVDADDEQGALAEPPGPLAEPGAGLLGRQIADGRSREEAEPRRVASIG